MADFSDIMAIRGSCDEEPDGKHPSKEEQRSSWFQPQLNEFYDSRSVGIRRAEDAFRYEYEVGVDWTRPHRRGYQIQLGSMTVHEYGRQSRPGTVVFDGELFTLRFNSPALFNEGTRLGLEIQVAPISVSQRTQITLDVVWDFRNIQDLSSLRGSIQEARLGSSSVLIVEPRTAEGPSVFDLMVGPISWSVNPSTIFSLSGSFTAYEFVGPIEVMRLTLHAI